MGNKIQKSYFSRFTLTPYILLLPALALFFVFTFYPFLKTVVLSFAVTNRSGKFATWVGFGNWIRILSKESFWQTVLTTLKFAAMNLVFTFAIAMVFALLSTRKTRVSKIYQTLFALPLAIASSPAAAIWLFMFRQESGLINYYLNTSFAWAQDVRVALYAVSMVTVWMHIGSSFIFLLVGFRGVPDELLESSMLDGAGPLRRIFSVMIPMASPQIFFVLFLNITSSFKTFAQIKLMTNGGPSDSTKTLIYSIYDNAIIKGRFETACVEAIFLFVLIFLVTRIQFLLENKVVHYQ